MKREKAEGSQDIVLSLYLPPALCLLPTVLLNPHSEIRIPKSNDAYYQKEKPANRVASPA